MRSSIQHAYTIRLVVEMILLVSLIMWLFRKSHDYIFGATLDFLPEFSEASDLYMRGSTDKHRAGGLHTEIIQPEGSEQQKDRFLFVTATYPCFFIGKLTYRV